MLATLVLERAQSVLNQSTKYTLGKGNFSNSNPQRPLGHEADCSGFVAWCMMRNRKTEHPFYVKINGGWLDTYAIYHDVRSSVGFYDQLNDPEPGAILVYPDKDGREGHIGIVVKVDGPGIEGVREVIHCSKGNYVRHGDAIRITDADIWRNREDSVVGWYVGLERSPMT